MSETAIGIWVIVVFVIMLNGCSAGVVGILYGWRSKMRRGGKILTAVAVSALLPASMFIPMGILDSTLSSSEGPIIMGVAFAMVFAMGLVTSLPGALILARKLEAPDDDFRTFE